MNADNVNKWLTLSANIGVVNGLVLLIVEIGQNTEMMRAQINQSRTATAISEQQAVFNSDYMPALLAKLTTLQEITACAKDPYFRGFRGF